MSWKLIQTALGKREDPREGKEKVNVVRDHCSERYSSIKLLKDAESYSIVELRSGTVCTEWDLWRSNLDRTFV